MQKISILLFLILVCVTNAFSQCITTISTFPYTQGFEANTGGWASGGTGNDWAWGTPSKTFITSAGGGSKCWVIGGLTGSFYTNAERSYVTSPCFDFSSLTNPSISFKIYWECENTYDGATFQYSLDNGLTWTNVGSDADPVDCMTQNWFNSSNIINLSTLANPKNGWAGSSLPTSGSCQGGGGSNGWVTAKHCLANLAGLPSVRFRFAFGAGTSCNNFDGVAFDDIKIEQAPLNVAGYTYACTSTSLQYQFTNTSTLCPNSIVWNFGDPASGANNGTGVLNPTHIFSSPGTYTVTLMVSGPCNGSSTITHVISTLGASVTPSNITCASLTNGSLVVIATNNTGTTNYSLQPTGNNNTTGNFSGLGPGTYTVSVSDAIGCSMTTTATITSPNALNWSGVISNNITCHGLQDGKINATCNGGTGTINYTVNPGGYSNTSGSFTSLPSGTYTITASDANGCSLTSVFTIIDPPSISLNTLTSQNVLCKNAGNGSIQLNYTGGTGLLTYQIMPGGSSNNNGQFINLSGGTYTITCTDLNGCSNSNIIPIAEPPALVISSIDIKQPGCNPNNDGTITVNAVGGSSPLTYSIGGLFGSNNFFSNMTSNTYTVVVKDANSCTVSSLAVLLSIDAPLINLVVENDVLCFGDKNGSIIVNASGTSPIQQISLSPGSFVNTSGVFQSLSSNIYTITVTDVNGCTSTREAEVDTPPLLYFQSVDYINDSCGSNTHGRLVLDVRGGTGIYTYYLNPGNKQQSSNIFDLVGAGNYVVKAVDANSCEVSTNISIPERICCDQVFVPNAFTPNNDGKNDEFSLKGSSGIELSQFMIYNRWGELVFNGQNLFDSWNGHYKGGEAEMGTYYYQVKYRCLSTNKIYFLKGDVTLIR